MNTYARSHRGVQRKGITLLLDYQLFSLGEIAMRSYASVFQVFVVLSALFFLGFSWAVWSSDGERFDSFIFFALTFVFVSNSAVFYLLSNMKNRAINDNQELDSRFDSVWREFDEVRREVHDTHRSVSERMERMDVQSCCNSMTKQG
jgi:hypothetical protein